VVGVVDDMRQETLGGEAQPEGFASFRQLAPTAMRIDPILVLRTTGEPSAVVPALRAAVRDAAPTLAIDSVMSMEDRVAGSLARPRLYAVVLAWFGAFAVLIATVGLFGVLSFSVAQRTREIGVRSALGAQAADIVGLVARQALLIVGLGVAVGVAAALGVARLLAAVLHGLSPYDAVTYVAVPVAIALAAVLACIGPARRAARVDPLSALRRG
jgi:putative ABC transport system permease protein